MTLSDTSRLLKALGDETRLRLLNLLRKGELAVGEVQEILNMGQSRISTQLTHMKDVGLVSDRRAGRRSYYSVAATAPIELLEQVLGGADMAPEFRADDAGTWVWHCHILNHVEREDGMFGMVTAVVVNPTEGFDPDDEPTTWTEAEMGRAIFTYKGQVDPGFMSVHS